MGSALASSNRGYMLETFQFHSAATFFSGQHGRQE